MAAIVSLRGIVKRYPRGEQRVTVLDGLDLDVDSGEFVALRGPSGSGKTTLLNLIGGLDRADEGTVTVSGWRLDTLSPAALTAWRGTHIGFVFQFYHLLPTLSAERNVEIPLLTTRLSRYERRRNARAALDLVGLIPRAEHRPPELSGGQQQRVAIARALVSDPKILVCDEPTGDLDRATAAEILELLQNLNEQLGTTIVMVTHDPLAAECASRVLHIDKDRRLHS
jgi:putative ABC transport system ATP-binding protein